MTSLYDVVLAIYVPVSGSVQLGHGLLSGQKLEVFLGTVCGERGHGSGISVGRASGSGLGGGGVLGGLNDGDGTEEDDVSGVSKDKVAVSDFSLTFSANRWKGKYYQWERFSLYFYSVQLIMHHAPSSLMRREP